LTCVKVGQRAASWRTDSMGTPTGNRHSHRCGCQSGGSELHPEIGRSPCNDLRRSGVWRSS
jgi:hypothetical protein